MKITHLSDTHGRHRKVKDIPYSDVLVHTGDFSSFGERREVEDFFSWFERQPHTYKILIAGNHDITFDGERVMDESDQKIGDKPDWVKDILINFTRWDGLNFYLEASGCQIEGVNFWGSPYTPKFGAWVFMKEKNELLAHWHKMPLDTDVLLTHGPAYGRLDYSPHWEAYCGDEALRNRIDSVRPALHLFGHIHEAYGLYRSEHTVLSNGALAGLRNEITNRPRVFTLNDKIVTDITY